MFLDGWVGGEMGFKAILMIAYRNQKLCTMTKGGWWLKISNFMNVSLETKEYFFADAILRVSTSAIHSALFVDCQSTALYFKKQVSRWKR